MITRGSAGRNKKAKKQTSARYVIRILENIFLKQGAIQSVVFERLATQTSLIKKFVSLYVTNTCRDECTCLHRYVRVFYRSAVSNSWLHTFLFSMYVLHSILTSIGTREVKESLSC